MAFDEKRTSVVLRRRPHDMPQPEDFELVTDVVPAPGEGEVVVRSEFLSIDPYMRGLLWDRKSHSPPVGIGAVMPGETVGRVVASSVASFSVGDLVVGGRGWSTHTVSPATGLTKIGGVAPPSAYLGVLGMPGFTAYIGITDIAQLKPGETALISAASGAVGSVAGQLAKRAGARVVGIAGGQEKCRYVEEQLGFDACVDHRAEDFQAAIVAACPNGVDVYYENVGGHVQNAAFAQLNTNARVVMCGMVSQSNSAELAPGLNLGFVVPKRVTIRGLVYFDHLERFPEWRALAAPWVADRTLIYRETILNGLENAPKALALVLSGGNFGKMLIKL